MKFCTVHIAMNTVRLIGLFFVYINAQTLKIEVTSHSSMGMFMPENACAVWIQRPDLTIVKTLRLYSESFCGMLMNWAEVAEEAPLDAVTSATRSDHGKIHETWNLKDYTGAQVCPGAYEFCVEFSEDPYWWGLFDTTEEYLGHLTWGSIVIDSQYKTVVVDEQSLYFSDFSATYDPLDMGIITVIPQTYPVTITQNSAGITVTLATGKRLSAQASVYTCKGQRICQTELASDRRGQYECSMSAPSGTGLYLLELREKSLGRLMLRQFTVIR